MKYQLFLLFLLIIPLIPAQPIDNYNDYTFIDISFKLNSDFNMIQQGSNPRIEQVQANITFLPKNEINQEVLSLNTFSTPLGQSSINEDSIGFSWNNPSLGNYNFGLNSITRITNIVVPIDSKISFPLNINSPYTHPTEFIDTNDDIKNKALELAQGEDDEYVVAFNIAIWVEHNIQYNLSTLTADALEKSSWVYKNKYGVCDELTNLYISMLRSLGIPARYISGMAYTNLNNDFGPHAWAEVYFPDKGWVPFDITYKEFGWIDPTHIKLKTNIDSGDPSIKYSWKSSNVQIESKNIDLEANVINKGMKISPPVEIKLTPLINDAGPGSYVPIEVDLRNKNQYYTPLAITITKAFNLTDSNTQYILLKPGESKKIFWITQIPSDLQQGYTYTGVLEVKDQFNSLASNEISYSVNSDLISLQEANEIISSEQVNEEQKVYSPKLKLDCQSKDKIFTYEKANVNCELKNTGNTLINNIKACILTDCQQISDLSISESKNISFELNNLNQGSNNVLITASNSNTETTDLLQINFLDSPGLEINEFNYSKIINYKDNFQIKSSFISKAPVKDVTLQINKDNIINIGKFDSNKNLIIEAKGSNFKDNIEIKVNYKDINNKEYSFSNNFPITITNVPWYIKLLRFFRLL